MSKPSASDLHLSPSDVRAGVAIVRKAAQILEAKFGRTSKAPATRNASASRQRSRRAPHRVGAPAPSRSSSSSTSSSSSGSDGPSSDSDPPPRDPSRGQLVAAVVDGIWTEFVLGARRLLTAREAAAYCGFKTTGAIRKLKLEVRDGQVTELIVGAAGIEPATSTV